MWSLRNKSIVLLTLLNMFLCVLWNPVLVIKNIPKYFSAVNWVTLLLLKISGGWGDFWILQEQIIFKTWLLSSRLKFVFHWKTQAHILFKSLFEFFAEKSLSLTTEKWNMSLANNGNRKLLLQSAPSWMLQQP